MVGDNVILTTNRTYFTNWNVKNGKIFFRIEKIVVYLSPNSSEHESCESNEVFIK